MLEKIIIGCFIVIVVVLETMLLSVKKDKLVDEVQITIPIQGKKEFYVSVVPKVNHEIITTSAVNKDGDTKYLSVSSDESFNSDLKMDDINELSNESNYETLNEDEQNYAFNLDGKRDIELKANDDKTENQSSKEIDDNLNQDIVVVENDETKIYNLKQEDIENEAEIVESSLVLRNGFVNESGITYYYDNDVKVTGIKRIDGVNNYFSPSGKHLGTNNIKVIDVSYYQGVINWDLFAEKSDCYGVILRLGYFDTLDKMFERNISELKKLNIPYGIYLFSYSTTLSGAKKEADFTNKMIDKYNLEPSLGIYYDIESWSTNTSNSNNISKTMYDNIIQYYVNSISNHTNYKYKVKVYSGRWYAMNRLGNISKKYVDWVAEYNKTCKYDDEYFMWQYTSKGSMPGIDGNVDISYIL